MRIGTEVAGKSIVGNRDSQQDFFRLVLSDELESDDETLLVLADGMGGAVGGGEASRIAVDTFAYTYRHAGNGGRVRDRLRHALQAANSGIREATAANENLRGMGSTLAAVLIRPQRVIWASVGDSLVLRYDGRQLRRLNADHSMRGQLDQLVEAGRLSSSEAIRHPDRNALRSALCGEPLQLIDVNLTEIAEGDIVLVASDGVQTLTNAEIEKILDRHQDKSAAELVELCLREVERAHDVHQDNATLIICKYNRRRPAGSIWGMPTSLRYGLLAGLVVVAAAAGAYSLLSPWPESAPPAATGSENRDAATGAPDGGTAESTGRDEPSEWQDVESGQTQSDEPTPATGDPVAKPETETGSTTPEEDTNAEEDAPAAPAGDPAVPADEAGGDQPDQNAPPPATEEPAGNPGTSGGGARTLPAPKPKDLVGPGREATPAGAADGEAAQEPQRLNLQPEEGGAGENPAPPASPERLERGQDPPDAR